MNDQQFLEGQQPAYMDHSALEIDELDHELTIRGVPLEGATTRAAKITLLDEHSPEGAEPDAIAELDVLAELAVLRVKVAELRALVKEAQTRTRTKRACTLYVHVVERIRRLMFKNAVYFEQFQELAKKINLSQCVLAEDNPDLIFPKVYDPDEDTSEEEKELAERQREAEKAEKQKAREARRKAWEEHESSKVKSDSESGDHTEASVVSKSDSKRTQKSTKEKESHKQSEKKNNRDEKKIKEEYKKSKEDERKSRTEDSDRRTEKKKKRKSRETYREQKHYKSDTSSDSSSSSSSSSSEGLRVKKKKSHSRRRRNPVTSWNFKYGGARSQDLHGFLEDIEEAMDANDVSEDELLRGVGALLEEDAKVWHRQKRSKIGSWDVFKTQIRNAFTPDDNDEELLEKISGLRQRSEETFAVFEARCAEMFQRLNRPLSEAEKLRKIYKGLHLYYKSRIKSRDIDSLRTLRRECRDLEADKGQIMKQEKEEKKKEKKKDEKEDRRDSRRHPRVSGIAQIDSEEDNGEGAPAVSAIRVPGSNAIVCWMCRETGHYAISCPNRRFCVVCGAPNTSANDCERCKAAELARLWKKHPSPENRSGGSAPAVVMSPFSVPPPPIPHAAQRTNNKPQGKGK
ncbi:golgin subfamily A member 6-like protein 6 [Thrips palmi]|uniref:Golgin subfamily A member 6-like protein 6 n=1 Tax=Thrips palmi TaxID=161013 RepID=A0A6P8YED0_THRPL|nr:golgin subfamily A member 6-like protein 6 [Thrips palmi]